MNTQTLNGILPKVAAGLAVLGIAGAVSVYANQGRVKDTAEDAATEAKECCDMAHENERDIAVIGSKLDGFKEQYDKDQAEAARQRQQILDAVKGE